MALKNVEADEAGKLAAFRERFGGGFEVDSDLFGEQGQAEVKDDAGNKAKAAKGKKVKVSRRTSF